MADEKRNIQYSFTGDTSSLQQATAKAIRFLDKIQSAVLKVDSSTSSAAKNTNSHIQATVTKLNSLITAVNKTQASISKMSSGNQFSKLRSEVTAVASSVGIDLTYLSARFDPLIRKIQSMADHSATAFKRIGTTFGQVTQAFRRVSKSADDAEEHIDDDADAAEKVSKGFSSALLPIKNFTKNISDLAKKASNTNTILKGTSAITKTLGTLFRSIAGIGFGAFIGSIATEAIHYAETLNMFEVVMDDTTKAAKRFVNQMQEVYSLDPKTIMQHTSMFYQLASAVEAPTEAARAMAFGMTKMSTDVASLFDMDIEGVAENFTSGLQGMTRAVRKFGMDIRTTTLETTALSLGLKINANTTSEANRIGLRYITMMRQAYKATEDFGKTLSSPANQLRIMKEQFAQLARAIGSFFLPILSKVLPVLNGIIMAIRTIIEFIAKLFGVEVKSFGGMTDAAENLGNTVSGIGDSASDAANKLKQLVAPFDELNVLSESQATTGIDTSGLGSDVMDPKIYEEILRIEEAMNSSSTQIKNRANEIRDSILNFLGFKYEDVIDPDTGEIERSLIWVSELFQKNLVDKFPQWKKTIDATFENWDSIINSVARLANVLYNAFSTMCQRIVKIVKNQLGKVDWDSIFAQFISELPDKLNAVSNWIEQNQNAFETLTFLISGLGLAFKAFGGFSGIVAIFETIVTKLNPVTAAISILAGVLVTAYTTSEKVREAFNEMFSAIDKAVESFINVILSFWNAVLKPILDNIISLLKELWSEHLQKLVEQIGLLVADIISLISAIMPPVLAIISLLVDVFGPAFSEVFNGIMNVVGTVVGIIVDLLSSVLQVLDGVITFLTGIFQGDWKKAWEGISKILDGIWSGMVSIVKGAINLIIDLINGLVDTVWSALTGIVNGILDVVNSAADFLGFDIDLRVPNKLPKIPHLATGGVVINPTLAVLGEGRYDEAVVPLDNSPQMKDLIQQIVDGINSNDNPGNGSDRPIVVKVMIGDKSWDAFTYESYERGKTIVGKKPIVRGV